MQNKKDPWENQGLDLWLDFMKVLSAIIIIVAVVTVIITVAGCKSEDQIDREQRIHDFTLAAATPSAVVEPVTTGPVDPVLRWVSVDDFIEHMGLVESGNDDQAISPAGARGRYQIMSETWYDFSDKPYEQFAHCPVESRKVAKTYVVWLADRVDDDGVVSVRNIAAAYNGGIGRLWRAEYDISKMPRETQAYVRLFDDWFGKGAVLDVP